MTVDPSALLALVDRLDALARPTIELGSTSDAARARAIQLRDHVGGHLRGRAASLDAPLVVILLGPTGAGKSTLFNTIAGRRASATGVLRPTTREAVLLAHPDDVAAVRSGPLAAIGADRLRVVDGVDVPRGLVLVDAPDIDSIEHDNRRLADALVEAADLAIFVTTATRYADRVPWSVLERVRERGLPLLVLVNRMPAAESDQAVVVADVRRLFADAGLDPEPAGVVAVAEGRLADDGVSLQREPIQAILDRIAALRADATARRELGARALAGSVAGLGPLVDRIADDMAHEAIDVAALRRGAADTFGRELAALLDELHQGRFLRDEALRHWQAYVGADDITRFFAKGLGAIRGAIAALIRPTTAPVAEVRGATTDDIVAVANRHVAEASRRTATAWADEKRVAAQVTSRPELWAPSSDFDGRLRAGLDAWMASIAAEIAETGAGKRRLAQGATLGVNAVTVGVMLATFIHTAGLTGAEVGIAAGTAFLNQRLLAALFGEAAMVELIGRARRRLDATVGEAFAEERERFDSLLPPGAELDALVPALRAAAVESRAFAMDAASAPPVAAAPTT